MYEQALRVYEKALGASAVVIILRIIALARPCRPRETLKTLQDLVQMQTATKLLP